MKNPPKPIYRFNTDAVEPNDVIVFEVSENEQFASQAQQIHKFFVDIAKKCPPSVLFLCVRKGDFMTLHREAEMNREGWYFHPEGKPQTNTNL